MRGREYIRKVSICIQSLILFPIITQDTIQAKATSNKPPALQKPITSSLHNPSSQSPHISTCFTPDSTTSRRPTTRPRSRHSHLAAPQKSPTPARPRNPKSRSSSSVLLKSSSLSRKINGLSPSASSSPSLNGDLCSTPASLQSRPTTRKVRSFI